MEFEQQLGYLLSPDNVQRKAAAEAFETHFAAQPEEAVARMMQTLTTSQNGDIRSLVAVLLRRLLPKRSGPNQEIAFTRLSPPTIEILKQSLIAHVEVEPVDRVRKVVTDSMVEVLSLLDGQWNEIQPTITRWIESGNPGLQESGMRLFGAVAEVTTNADQLAANPNIINVFTNCLGEKLPPRVRSATIRAIVSFVLQLVAIEAPSNQLKPYQTLLGPILKALGDFLNAGEEDIARTNIERLVEVVDDTQAKFFRSALQPYMEAMKQIVASEALDENLRKAALEFITCTVEASPGMCRKLLPGLAKDVFQLAMMFVLDIEDDNDWHTADNEEYDALANEEIGMQAMDRLALAYGAKTTVPICIEILPPFLNHPSDWRFRHAGLMAVSQVAEVMPKQGPEIFLTSVMTMLEYPHPRVRWAAIHCVGQLSTDWGPQFQNNYHAAVIPALVKALDDVENPRVQGHAASAIINFTSKCSSKIINNYMGPTLQKLIEVLQQGKKIVQVQALSAISSIAGCAEELFTPFYSQVMPMMKQVVMSAHGKEFRELRAKGIECISLIGEAVGKAVFHPDAKEVIDTMITLQSQAQDPDDPQRQQILLAWPRICKILGQDFVPYLPLVIDPLLEAAGTPPDMKIELVEDEEAVEPAPEEGVEVIRINDQRISLRTSALEEKSAACNTLADYVEYLQEGFFPYVEPVFEKLIPLLKFYYNEDVREAASRTMPGLLSSAKQHLSLAGADISLINVMFEKMFGAFLAAVVQEYELEIACCFLDDLSKAITVMGDNCLDAAKMGLFMEMVRRLLGDSAERRQMMAQQAGDEFFDEEGAADLEDQTENEERLMIKLAECLGKVIKVQGAHFMNCLDTLLGELKLKLASPSCTIMDKRFTMYVVDDVIEHCKLDSQRYWPDFLPFVMDGANSADVPLRQAAVYGLGVFAEFGGEAFAPHVVEALQRLSRVVTDPAHRSEENETATDNAVSAVAKICLHQSRHVEVNSILPSWLQYLPVTGDEEEGQVVHAQLMTFLEQGHPAILGEGNQNLPHILKIFTLIANTDSTNDEVNRRVGNFLAQLHANAPADLEKIASQMTQAERELLQSYQG